MNSLSEEALPGPTILVVEKFHLFASAIKAMLESHQPRACIHTTCSLPKAANALSALPEISLVILGNTADEAEAIPAIKKITPGIPVALFKEKVDAMALQRAFLAGAAGLFSAETTQQEFANGIGELLNGRRYAPAAALHEFIDRAIAGFSARASSLTGIAAGNETQHAPNDELRFSPRERQIIELMSQGASNKEIARALQISVGTAKNYVGSILQRCGVSSRLKVVARFKEAEPSSNGSAQTNSPKYDTADSPVTLSTGHQLMP